VNHQFYHLSGREVFARRFVAAFCKLENEMLEDVAHFEVAHAVQVKPGKFFGDFETRLALSSRWICSANRKLSKISLTLSEKLFR